MIILKSITILTLQKLHQQLKKAAESEILHWGPDANSHFQPISDLALTGVGYCSSHTSKYGFKSSNGLKVFQTRVMTGYDAVTERDTPEFPNNR